MSLRTFKLVVDVEHILHELEGHTAWLSSVTNRMMLEEQDHGRD